MAEVLTALAATIEAHDPMLRSTVLLADQQQRRLMRGAGQLIDGYVTALEGTPFDAPHANPCAFSADTGAEAVVVDIASDPRWPQDWRRQALHAGLRACRTIPVRLSDGSVAAVLAIYHRVSEGDLSADSRLVRLTTQLLSLVVERHHFEESLHEAAQRKDEFLAALAHELRNPLAPIRHAVEMLQRPDFDTARLPQTATMLARQVRQLLRLVDDLLDINRASRGRIRLQLSEVSLADVVAQAVETATAMYGRADDLEVLLPDTPIVLLADPARLQQVLGNLLANAFKFSEPGSRVHVSVATQSGEAVLRVRDHGIGMAPQDRRRIFEPFFQVDTSLERTTSGLGVGLTLAEQLVRLHGGRLTADSPGLGQGSVLELRLPLNVAVAPPPPPAPVEQAGQTGKQVLVVDDNVDAADSLALLLRMIGHRVNVAHDGPQALQVAAQSRPDTVLLDIGLPRTNGLEVSRRIREQPWGRDMHVVALTGWSQEADRARSRAAGIDAHLVKPVDLVALLDVLRAGRPPR